MLGQTASAYDAKLRQFDGDILDWLTGENDSILISREYVPEVNKLGSRIARTASGIGVDLLDTRTLESKKIIAPTRGADDFITDGRGNVRIKEFQQRDHIDGNLTAKTVYHYRLTDSTDWLPFSTWENRVGMRPIDIDADTNSAYVLKTLGDHLALYRVKLDGTMATELVFKNDKVDVGGVVKVRRNSRAIGVTFAEEDQQTKYFDPSYERLVTDLSQAIPNLPMVDVMSSSVDEKRLLIRAGSDIDPGRYYVYDNSKRSMHELALVRPELENVVLSRVKSIQYPAQDGTFIPAYLTLPPGKDNARGLPAIVMPHGGPSARDVWGFDWMAQAFAYHGYAVIQPNFRGSAGFGGKWMVKNGIQNWQTSVGDVVDAGRWLIKEGIADANQLAIIGWSYGGYAALQSNVSAPTLFKAVVAIAPVTDFGMLREDANDFTNKDLVKEFVGEGKHIQEGSPLQRANDLIAPVLMFHGDKDINVRISHSQKMHAALDKLGKTNQLIEYKDLAHSLADSKVRIDMLEKIAAFLQQHKIGSNHRPSTVNSGQ